MKGVPVVVSTISPYFGVLEVQITYLEPSPALCGAYSPTRPLPLRENSLQPFTQGLTRPPSLWGMISRRWNRVLHGVFGNGLFGQPFHPSPQPLRFCSWWRLTLLMYWSFHDWVFLPSPAHHTYLVLLVRPGLKLLPYPKISLSAGARLDLELSLERGQSGLGSSKEEKLVITHRRTSDKACICWRVVRSLVNFVLTQVFGAIF